METTIAVEADRPALTTLQAGWVEYVKKLLVDPTARCHVHVWDAQANRRATIPCSISANDAMNDGLPVVARHRSTIALLDLDAPKVALTPGQVAADREAAAWAAGILGVLVVVTPSGTILHDIESLSGVALTPSRRHAQAYTDLVAARLGHRMVARLGQSARTLMSPGYQPTHSLGLPRCGGILDPAGRFIPMPADEVEALHQRTAPVPAGRLDALLAEHGAARTSPAALLDFDQDEAPTQSVSAWFDSLSQVHQDLARTDGTGWAPSDPGSRHQGEMSVIDALVARGASVGDVYAFLSAWPIGDRMRREARQGGKVVTRRTARAQRRHVKRAVKNARAFLLSGGGDRRARLGEKGRTLIDAAWAVDVPPEQRVAFAVLAATCVRLDRAVVGLSHLQLEILTALDGGDVASWLRGHPCVREVQTGSALLGASTWEIVAPTDELDRIDGLPSWSDVADVAGSDLAAAGILAGRERAVAFVMVAMMEHGRAVGPTQFSHVVWRNVRKVGRALTVLEAAGVVERHAGRYTLATALWIRAIELTVHGEVDLKRAAQAKRLALWQPMWAEAQERYAASRAEYDDDSDLDEPCLRLTADEVIDADDPAGEFLVAWLDRLDLPEGSDDDELARGSAALARRVTLATEGDLERAATIAVQVADAASVWAWMWCAAGRPAPTGTTTLAVAHQAVDLLMRAQGPVGFDLDLVASEAARAGTAWLGGAARAAAAA